MLLLYILKRFLAGHEDLTNGEWKSLVLQVNRQPAVKTKTEVDCGETKKKRIKKLNNWMNIPQICSTLMSPRTYLHTHTHTHWGLSEACACLEVASVAWGSSCCAPGLAAEREECDLTSFLGQRSAPRPPPSATGRRFLLIPRRFH